jgi:hypothetical protein
MKRALASVVIAAGVVAAVLVLSSSSSDEAPPPVSIHAEDCRRQVIYHSPQTPGYTAWVGAWEMPDESLMVGFTQATGPVDLTRRPRASESLKATLGAQESPPGYDFWGLDLSAEYLRSRDGGRSWSAARSDSFQALYPHPYAAQATLALPDGTLVRRVNGHDLAHDPSVPHTAYLQRLAPGASGWSEPEVLLDPARFTYQISRIRRLGDGRLIGLGQYWKVAAGTPQAELLEAPADHLLLVSEDDGKSWTTNPIQIPPGSYVAPSEWDAAELPGGDLLAVFRTNESSESSTPVRRQGRLEKRDGGWVLTDVRDAPLPHSGHPELLALQEGAVLHIATNGIHWTADGGTNWKPLRFRPPVARYGSPYYPRALELEDGSVYVFGHRGHDDPYGAVDQAIVMDRFRVVRDSGALPPASRRGSRGGCGRPLAPAGA